MKLLHRLLSIYTRFKKFIYMDKTVFSVLKWASVSGVLLVAMSCRRTTPGLEIAQLVKTAEVQKYDGECSTTYPGKIKAASDVQLAFRVAGPILRFNAGGVREERGSVGGD